MGNTLIKLQSVQPLSPFVALGSPRIGGPGWFHSCTTYQVYVPISCSCAQITNEKGYTHFGIQNLGECRSGVNVGNSFASQGARVAFTHQGPRPWVGCLGKGMKQCKRPSLSCVGQDQTNYVFGVRDSKFNNLSQMVPKVIQLNVLTTFNIFQLQLVLSMATTQPGHFGLLARRVVIVVLRRVVVVVRTRRHFTVARIARRLDPRRRCRNASLTLVQVRIAHNICAIY